MQKFGLRTDRTSRHSLIEIELIKESASALGRAGRKLRLSLEAYDTQQHRQLSSERRRCLIQSIADDVWQLLLQREFLGFIEGNLEWINAHYVIPPEALAGLGGRA